MENDARSPLVRAVMKGMTKGRKLCQSCGCILSENGGDFYYDAPNGCDPNRKHPVCWFCYDEYKEPVMFKSELERLGGFWQYKDGARYLAMLASGKVSNVFCNTGVITTRPAALSVWAEELADDVVASLDAREDFPGREAKQVYVIGPGMGGITLAYALADAFSVSAEPFDLGTEFTSLFTEPVDNGVMKFQKFRFEIPKDALVILCEDVITTGGSVQKTMDAICEEFMPTIAPVVACLVDRRAEKGLLTLSKRKDPADTAHIANVDVVSLLSITPRTWDTIADARNDFPAVVDAIRPKANWAKLIGG